MPASGAVLGLVASILTLLPVPPMKILTCLTMPYLQNEAKLFVNHRRL
jgi:hypothetical protein